MTTHQSPVLEWLGQIDACEAAREADGVTAAFDAALATLDTAIAHHGDRKGNIAMTTPLYTDDLPPGRGQLRQTTYRLDTNALTVFAVDRYGTELDLNAEGEPCQNLIDLRGFVIELRSQGLTKDWSEKLLAEIAEIEAMHTAVAGLHEAALEMERDDEEVAQAETRDRPGRGDLFVLTEALEAFTEPVGAVEPEKPILASWYPEELDETRTS